MLSRYISTHRRTRLVHYLARKCARFLECYENADNYAFDENGERFVLEAWAACGFSCIFDVGANIGDWALLAHGVFPNAKIHCFEIMRSTAEELRRRASPVANITVNDHGLADRAGEVSLRYFPAASSLTTMTDYPHEFAHIAATGRVLTGDAYVASQGIERVDLLKLDVEGAEGLVLKGIEQSLRSGKIDVVQFEYGKVSILTKWLLRDFYLFFAERGYRVGKLYPNHVEFRDYEFTHEDFRGANYLAIRTQRPELIDAVS